MSYRADNFQLQWFYFLYQASRKHTDKTKDTKLMTHAFCQLTLSSSGQFTLIFLFTLNMQPKALAKVHLRILQRHHLVFINLLTVTSHFCLETHKPRPLCKNERTKGKGQTLLLPWEQSFLIHEHQNKLYPSNSSNIYNIFKLLDFLRNPSVNSQLCTGIRNIVRK